MLTLILCLAGFIFGYVGGPVAMRWWRARRAPALPDPADPDAADRALYAVDPEFARELGYEPPPPPPPPDPKEQERMAAIFASLQNTAQAHAWRDAQQSAAFGVDPALTRMQQQSQAPHPLSGLGALGAGMGAALGGPAGSALGSALLNGVYWKPKH